MRNISFALTTDQIRARTKTVTRRLGWKTLRPGTLLRAVVKSRGLKPGETVQPLAVIRVVKVTREPLREIARHGDDPALEGYPQMTPEQFVAHFCGHMKVTPDTEVTRIEFEYVDEEASS